MQAITVLIIILCVLIAVLALALILQGREQRYVASRIRELKSMDTNTLIDSPYSAYKRELINEINSLLVMLRNERAVYARKNHDLEQMMTNISHDLRTPLTSALGFVSLSISEEDKAERDRELEITQRRLKRLEELLDQFFEFSKVISGSREIEKKELRLIALLEEAVSHFYDDYNDRGRRIELNYNSTKICIDSNEAMLMRVFDNLISDALKHGEETLFITVLEHQGSYA